MKAINLKLLTDGDLTMLSGKAFQILIMVLRPILIDSEDLFKIRPARLELYRHTGTTSCTSVSVDETSNIIIILYFA